MPDAEEGVIELSVARFGRHERPRWLAGAAALLNAEELARVASIVDSDTRAQHAVGRALIRIIGARAAGCSPGDLSVAVSDTGKPWLPQVPDLHVSISHSRQIVVVAATSVAPVGVDVEPPTAPTVDPQRLAQRLFPSAEARALAELSDGKLADGFSRLWTIKEAVAKALGVGVIPALSQVVVDPNAGDLQLVDVGHGPPADLWTLHQLTAPGGTEKIAVAIPAPGVRLAPVSVITLDQLAQAASAHGATARRWLGSAPRRARR